MVTGTKSPQQLVVSVVVQMSNKANMYPHMPLTRCYSEFMQKQRARRRYSSVVAFLVRGAVLWRRGAACGPLQIARGASPLPDLLSDTTYGKHASADIWAPSQFISIVM